jgi:hypothetical protein
VVLEIMLFPGRKSRREGEGEICVEMQAAGLWSVAEIGECAEVGVRRRPVRVTVDWIKNLRVARVRLRRVEDTSSEVAIRQSERESGSCGLPYAVESSARLLTLVNLKRWRTRLYR